MHYLNTYNFSLLLFLVSLCACSPEQNDRPAIEWTKDKSTELNKEIAEQEKIDIALYCDRIPNSEFKETGSGLLYWIIKASEGSTALPGDIVQVAYVISFLDGEVCYRTGKDEVKEFRVDKSDVETGIQEAIKLLGEGSKAKLIISSYLAHGLTGDNNKIPPLTPIVVDLEVIRLIKKR